jgi:hypothetical protein
LRSKQRNLAVYQHSLSAEQRFFAVYPNSLPDKPNFLLVRKYSFFDQHNSSAVYPRSFPAKQESLPHQQICLIFHRKSNLYSKRIQPQSSMNNPLLRQEESASPPPQENPCAFTGRRVDTWNPSTRYNDNRNILP